MPHKTPLKYQTYCLPHVSYQELRDSNYSLDDLEQAAIKTCFNFFNALEDALLSTGKRLPPEGITCHLGFYLGALTVFSEREDSVELIHSIGTTLFQGLLDSHELATNLRMSERAELTQFCQKSPGVIGDSTLKLGKRIEQILHSLYNNPLLATEADPEPDSPFCSRELLYAITVPIAQQQVREWQHDPSCPPSRYLVNQLMVQFSWLMGYGSYLSNMSPDPDKNSYLKLGISTVAVFIKNTLEVLDQIEEGAKPDFSSPSDDEQKQNTTLNEIRELSQKTQADVSPPVTEFQKKSAIFSAALEKCVMDLLIDEVPIKTALMSLFYFWFTLEQSILEATDNIHSDDLNPMEEMTDFIQLMKDITTELPEPEFSEDIKALNQKMQAAKDANLSPEDADKVGDHINVVAVVEKANGAIHGLTGEYLQNDYDPEIIANVLFHRWLHCSVFFGVSESRWQKMDHYFSELMTAARARLKDISQQ